MILERGALSTVSTDRASFSCVVHENPAHGLGGDGEEVRSTSPVHALLIHEPQVRFVDQSRGLERVPIRLATHVCRGQGV